MALIEMDLSVPISGGGEKDLNDTPIFADYVQNSSKTVTLDLNKSYVAVVNGLNTVVSGMGYLSVFKIIKGTMTTLVNNLYQTSISFNSTTGVLTFTSSSGAYSATMYVYEII